VNQQPLLLWLQLELQSVERNSTPCYASLQLGAGGGSPRGGSAVAADPGWGSAVVADPGWGFAVVAELGWRSAVVAEPRWGSAVSALAGTTATAPALEEDGVCRRLTVAMSKARHIPTTFVLAFFVVLFL
jgi:hypothetical protein